MDHLILAYLEGTASEEEIGLLLDWVRQSEENKKYFFDRRTIWLVSARRPASAGETKEAFSRFRTRVHAYEKSLARKKLYRKTARIAASVAWIAFFSLAAYWAGTYTARPGSLGRQDTPSSRPAVLHQTVVRAAKTPLVLPDHSVVWLNQGSRLTYPAVFTGGKRIVRLEGEGYFEVVPDAGHPFYVETEKMTVRVLGTCFDVKSHPEENWVETVLLSGKVEVHFENGPSQVVLAPSEKLAFDKTTGSYRIETVDADEYALWKNEKLVMKEEELGAIFRKMERWYGIRIVSREGVPLNARYSITITDEPKEEILRLLSIITPIRYEIENKQVTIRKK